MATYPSSPAPSYEYIEGDEFSVAVTIYPNGTEQRVKKRTVKRKSIVLSYARLKLTEAQILQAFFESMEGRLTSFNFTSFIDATSYVVRFDMDELVLNYVEYDQYSIGINLVEVKGETPGA